MKTFPIPSRPAPSGGEDNPDRGGGGQKAYACGGYVKGGDIGVGSYAAGGPVLGKDSEFLKTPDAVRTDKGVPQDYGTKGASSGGKDKSMTPVKPRT